MTLVWVVLVLCVFYPTVAPGDAATVDPDSLSFVSIFTGQIVLGGFLPVWWWLAQSAAARTLSAVEYWSSGDVRFGVGRRRGGVGGRDRSQCDRRRPADALGYTPSGGEQAPPFEVPPLLVWLAELPVWRKLVVVAVAMTVEEAFFRAFLQTRVGWVLSSALFALSHSGYGLPTLRPACSQCRWPSAGRCARAAT